MGIPAPLGVGASGLPNAGDQANGVISGTITAVGPTKPFAFRGPMNLVIYASVATTLATTKGSLTATVGSATGLAAGNSISSANVPNGATIGALSSTTATLALPVLTYGASGLSTSSANITLPPGSNVANLVGATVTVPSNNEQITIPSGTTVLAVVQQDVAPAGATGGSAGSPGTPGIVTLSNAPTLVPTNTVSQPLEFAPTGNAITTTGTDAAAYFTGAAINYSATVQIERSFDGGKTWVVCNVGGSGQLAQYATGTPVSITFGEPEKQVFYRLNAIIYSSGTINYRISQTGGAAESLAIGPLSGG